MRPWPDGGSFRLGFRLGVGCGLLGLLAIERRETRPAPARPTGKVRLNDGVAVELRVVFDPVEPDRHNPVVVADATAIGRCPPEVIQLVTSGCARQRTARTGVVRAAPGSTAQ
jgi:hypothetical protein